MPTYLPIHFFFHPFIPPYSTKHSKIPQFPSQKVPTHHPHTHTSQPNPNPHPFAQLHFLFYIYPTHQSAPPNRTDGRAGYGARLRLFLNPSERRCSSLISWSRKWRGFESHSVHIFHFSISFLLFWHFYLIFFIFLSGCFLFGGSPFYTKYFKRLFLWGRGKI